MKHAYSCSPGDASQTHTSNAHQADWLFWQHGSEAALVKYFAADILLQGLAAMFFAEVDKNALIEPAVSKGEWR
jgi:hypothetical protein